MALGYIPYGLAVFLTIAFSCAFLGATMGAAGTTRRSRAGRRGAHPLLIFVPVAVGFAVVLYEMTVIDLRSMLRGGGPPTLKIPLVIAMLGVAGATLVVVRIGLARQVLSAAYAATAVSLFVLPFAANLSRSMIEVPALMGIYAPTGLGLLLGGSLAWARRRERAALENLPWPATTPEGRRARRMPSP